MNEPKQVWECPVCHRKQKCPIPVLQVSCGANHNGKYTEVNMKLIQGEAVTRKVTKR